MRPRLAASASSRNFFMYLKSLEMIGFKSFAERTKLMFEPGIMAIVGPNGCGKSNVSDAVRWVLGEQSSKALRGSTMTDVIFNGTDQVKPLAMAEVSLTLADCESVLGTDYNEVTVTRRVFRSGEGQYLINKAPCRLKDIQRLFMDTGLGTDSYSVMEQGRIDQVLSSRPDDRREVFEEASGISKYKADRREALRKLEHTEANLLRLGDIIKEVKRQIISLQRQVGKAKRYKNLQEQLRGSEVWLAKGRLAELDAALNSLEAELKGHSAREEELRAGVEAADGQATQLRQDMSALEENIAAAMDAAAETAGELERTRERVRVNQERAQELEALSQRDSRETASARANLEHHQAELEVLKKDLIAAKDEHETARVELEERQAAFAEHERLAAAARQRLQDLRTEALDLESRLARLQNEWNEIDARERTDLIRRERFAAEKAEAERTVESYAERLGLMVAQRDAKQADAEAANQQVAALRQTQADRTAELEALSRELAELASAVAAREAQIHLLTRSRAEARGFPSGAKKCWKIRRFPAWTPSIFSARWRKTCALARSISGRWSGSAVVAGCGAGAGCGGGPRGGGAFAGGEGRDGAFAGSGWRGRVGGGGWRRRAFVEACEGGDGIGRFDAAFAEPGAGGGDGWGGAGNDSCGRGVCYAGRAGVAWRRQRGSLGGGRT